ncbi:MAG: SUMF1/EgtB/PvdO family nonheme iron enzyme [Planctomycetota bacterium]
MAAIWVVMAWAPATVHADFVRGDANGDGVVSLPDPIQTLSFLFIGGSVPCLDAADSNDDGVVDLVDATVTLAHLFSGGAALPAPFPGCGGDPTSDSLACAVTPAACPAYPGLTFEGPNAQGYAEYRLDVDPRVLLILIPGGTFSMGQAGVATPLHLVTLSPYFIGKHEITNAQYRLYCDATLTAYPPDPPFTGPGAMPNYFTNPLFENFPVVNVSWFDVQGYVAWAGLTLPTEAQWEFAARGTVGRTYPWGFDAPGLGAPPYRASFFVGTDGAADGWRFTSPVGAAPFSQFAGQFGTRDQAGNVWEWCQDWFGSYPSTPQVNPQGPAIGSARVYRGGSWTDVAILLQSALRSGIDPPFRSGNRGFRVARVIP